MLILGVWFVVLACVARAREGAASAVASCHSINPLVTDAWCAQASCAGEFKDLCSSSATATCSCAADDDACMCDEPPVPSANCSCRSGAPHISDAFCQAVQCSPAYHGLCVGTPCKSKSAHVTDEDCASNGCPSDVCECEFNRPSCRSISATVTDAWCAQEGCAGEYKELCETVREPTFPPTLSPSGSPSAAPSSSPTTPQPTLVPTRCAGGKCCTGSSLCYFSLAGPEEPSFATFDAMFCCKSGECVARLNNFMLDMCTLTCLADGGFNVSSPSTSALLSSTLQHCYQDRMPTNWGCLDEALAASSTCGQAENKTQCTVARDCIKATCPLKEKENVLNNNRLSTSGRGQCSSFPVAPVGPPVTRQPTTPPTPETFQCKSSAICDPKIVVPTVLNSQFCCKGGQTCYDWYGITGFCSGYSGPFPPRPTPRPTAFPTTLAPTQAPTERCGNEDQEGCAGEDAYQSPNVPACPADLTRCCYGSVEGCPCEGCGGNNGCQVSCPVEPAYPPEEGFVMEERGSFVVSREPTDRPLCKAAGIGGQGSERKCYDLSSFVTNYMTEALTLFPGMHDDKVDGFEIVIIGLLNLVIARALEGKFKDDFINRVSSGFCIGSFLGKYVLDHKGVGEDLQLYKSKCHKLLLHPDVEYTIVSVNLPAPLFAPWLCSTEKPKPDDMFGFCFAYTSCGTQVVLPDLGLALNKFAALCVMNNNMVAALSGGISTLLSFLGKFALDSTSVAVSTSGHMGMMVDLYSGEGPTSEQPKKVWAVANVGMTEEIAFTESSLSMGAIHNLCGGKDCFRFELNTALLISIFGHVYLSKQDQLDYVLSRDPETDVAGKWRVEHAFQQSATLTSKVSFAFLLGKMTRGVFPDIKSTIAVATLHMSGVPKAISGIPRGFYLWFNGAGAGTFITEAIVVPLIQPFSYLIDGIFGKDAARKIVNSLTGALGNDSTRVGMTFNGVSAFGALLKLPIVKLLSAIPPFQALQWIPGSAGLLGDMLMDIRIPADGSHVYFKLDFDRPRWFGVVWDGLKAGFYEFKDFFDPIGKYFGSGEGRGVGTIPNSCKDGYERNAGLCYEPCREGFYRAATMCVQRCPTGWRNDGLFCAKPWAYSRGAGRVMLGGCRGGREKWGLLCYPKCKEGYSAFGCCVCSPRCPSGMHDVGVSCAKHTYDTGVGSRMTCNSNRELQNGLCYKPCEDGKVGHGPVCWDLAIDILQGHRRRRALGAEHGEPFVLEGLYRETQDHPIWSSNQTVRNIRGEREPVFGTTWWNQESKAAH
jgi:hypothetical protein